MWTMNGDYMKLKFIFYIFIALCLVSVPFFYSASAGNYDTTFIWVPSGDHNASNVNNWHWKSISNYGAGRLPYASSNTNIQFLFGNVNCSWNLPGTFKDMYIGETYSGNISLSNDLTLNTLVIESGKLLVGNHTLTINGFLSGSNFVPIFNPQQNFDIGLVIIILACAIPFIGFIIHRFRKVEG